MNSFNRKRILMLLFFLFLTVQNIHAEYGDQYLAVGHPKNLVFNFSIGRVDIGDPQICNFQVDRGKNRITLLPTGPGETRLIVYDSGGAQKEAIKIIVSSKDLKRYVDELKRILKDVEGININQVESSVVIDGEVFLQEDMDTIKEVIKNTPFVINLVKVSRNAQRIIAKKIEKVIALPEVSVEPFKDKMILKGTVYSKDEAENSEKIAKLYWDEAKVVSILSVREIKKPPTRAKTIQITAHYIELNKVYNRNFLFKWIPLPQIQGTAQGTVAVPSGSTSMVGGVVATFTDLIPRLNYMRSLGIVRVFENPTVSVKSGEMATIYSGSTIYIPVAQETGVVSMEPKQVGVTLTVTPQQFKDDIDLKISCEVSALGTPTMTGLINVDTNQIETQQYVRSSESVVIGGILRTSSADIKDKQPEQGDEKVLPGLFTLFKSRDFSQARSQFLIYITPKLLDYAKDSNKELKDYFNLYEVYPVGD